MNQDFPRHRAAIAGWLGLAAVALYLGSMIIGGIIVPGYSHIENSVSELTSSAGAHRWGLAWGFAAYNVAFAGMGVGIAKSMLRTRALVAAVALWFLVAVAGVLMVTVFPQDPMHTDLTARGTGHVILAGVAALGLIVSAFLWSRAFRADASWAGLARPSFWFGWAILGIGGVGGILGGAVPSIFGLGERFTMVTYLSWFTVMAIAALRPAPSAASHQPSAA